MSNSTPEKQNAIAERLELAARIIREDLDFEVKDPIDDKWVNSVDPVTEYLDVGDWDLRVKPTPAPPKLVPLTAADIPPGSSYRHKAWPEHRWEIITGASVFVFSTSEGEEPYEDAFKNPCELLKRPGETTWGPFSKPEEPTTTPA